MKKFVIFLTIVLVAVVVFLIVKSGKVKNEVYVPQEVPDTGGVSGQFAKLAGDALVVLDQRPGDRVFVNAVNLSKNGFLIIKKDASGSPGAIVGVSEFLIAGDYSKIDVGTTESMADGLKYYASLYADNGDGIFDPKSDTEVRSAGGDYVEMDFMVSRDAADPRTVEINF